MKIRLLDCTLRDGGYVNDWCFGYDNIIHMVENLIKSGIDIIEVGFLDERVVYDRNKTILPKMEFYNDLFKNIDKGSSKLFAMIDYGTFSIDDVIDKKYSVLDGIRVIFTQDKIEDALNFCSNLKDKGYIVFANAVNITNYKKDDFDKLFRCINSSNIDGASIVDTYGLLSLNEALEYYNLFDNNLNENMDICFHAHNTLQLALGNCLSIINGANNKRMTYIDASLSGMGKGSGNAYTEILVRYLNSLGYKYNLSYVLDLIEKEMSSISKQYNWNYSTVRFLSSINNVYYKYTDYYLKVKGLSYSVVEEIERLIDDCDRYKFSTDLALKYYDKYMNLNDKCVIFDIDGTLLDTTNGILSSVDYVIKNFNLHELSFDEKLKFIGPPIQDSFKRVYNLDDDVIFNLASAFRNHYKDEDLYKATLYDGIIDLLSFLKLNGFKIGIATYKREDYTLSILKYFGIDKYCDSIHGSDFDGKLTKSDIVGKVMDDLNIFRAVMIGDCMSDYQAAMNNNIDFIGVSYGFGFKDGEKVDFKLVSSVQELRSCLIGGKYEDQVGKLCI